MSALDWSSPTLSDTYSDFLADLKARDEDCATMFNGFTGSNQPTNAVRWNASTDKFEIWSGSAWGDLSSDYAIDIAGYCSLAEPELLRLVKTSSSVTLVDGTGTLQIGPDAGDNIAFDTNDMQQRDGASGAGNLRINRLGGNIYFGGNLDYIFRFRGSGTADLTADSGIIQVGENNGINIGFDKNQIQCRDNTSGSAESDVTINALGGDVSLCADANDTININGVMGNWPSFSAYLASNYSGTSSSGVTIPWDTEVFDTDNTFNNTGSTVGGILARTWEPAIIGKYLICVTVQLYNVTVGEEVTIYLQKNASALQYFTQDADDGGFIAASFSVITDVTSVGDYFLVGIDTSSDTAWNLAGGISKTKFSGSRIG